MKSCVKGEAFIISSVKCFKCSKGTFSIKLNSTECNVCPKKGIAECPGADLLNISKGFWRDSIDSSTVEECKNMPENCTGGLLVGNGLCKKGHIGGLCESCDIYGVFWDEQWAKSSNF
jgi:hypothetical protein